MRCIPVIFFFTIYGVLSLVTSDQDVAKPERKRKHKKKERKRNKNKRDSD